MNSKTDSKIESLKELKKDLKRGYTTGTCAAGAAKAATLKALGISVDSVLIDTPSGKDITLDVLHGQACCGIKKDSGDDPDITDGIEVWAKVILSRGSDEISVDGGQGVGRVTLPGLSCPIGSAAINPVPMEMIKTAVNQVLEAHDYKGGAQVIISIPRGEELARRTYNPRLGIVGGLSVLGTSGIVEPMSAKALIDTIRVEMDVQKALNAKYIILTPGNYGETIVKQLWEEFNSEQSAIRRKVDSNPYYVKCSNFIGDSLDAASEKGFKGVLYVAHLGKLVKVAGGIMNTHSSVGDGRMEILSAHLALAIETATAEEIDKVLKACLFSKIQEAVTTDLAYEEIMNCCPSLWPKISASLMNKLKEHMELKTHGEVEVDALMFIHKQGCIGMTEGLKERLSLYYGGLD